MLGYIDRPGAEGRVSGHEVLHVFDAGNGFVQLGLSLVAVQHLFDCAAQVEEIILSAGQNDLFQFAALLDACSITFRSESTMLC
jgi:hypothetical protein